MTSPRGSFTTRFAVPLVCQGCKRDVASALLALSGVDDVSVYLPDQTVTVTGCAAPSAMIVAIGSTGRSAILRGSGEPESSAVCILETNTSLYDERVRGLARMIQVSPNSTLFDLTVHGVNAGNYVASIHETGDISAGAASTGMVWGTNNNADEGPVPRGLLGVLQVGDDKKGSLFVERSIQIQEITGRSIVLHSEAQDTISPQSAFAGVIARSAGMWENEKKVCSRDELIGNAHH